MQAAKTKLKKVALTKELIDKLKAPATTDRFYLYDSKSAGLCICVTSLGTKTFYVYRRLNGKPERIRLGEWRREIPTVDEARRIAAKQAGHYAEGTNPADAVRAKKQAPTLGSVFDEFILAPTRTKARRPKSPVTVIGYRQQFGACLEHWRERKLSSITKGDIERLHTTIGTERGEYMANRVLGLLKALFAHAIALESYNANPAAGLRGFEEVSRERFLHADELPRFWKALEEEDSEKVKDFIKILLFTGQRRMNCLQMRWADVDFLSATWNLPQTKTGRHSVPLTAAAIDVLKVRLANREDSEYVFPGRHGYEHLKDPMRQWREILKRAGIEDLRLHDLRRSMGSWQAATGASLTVIGKTLGHTRPETTAIYSRLESTPVRAAMETATAAILGAANPPKPVKAKANTARRGSKRSR